MVEAEKISKRVLYGLVAVIFVVFFLFFLYGFDRPFTDNPDFNAPLLTDVVLLLMGIMVVCGLAFALCSMLLSWRKRGKDNGSFNHIAVRRNACLVGGGTFLLLLITFILGNPHPIQVNGEEYSHSVWLRMADMFIYTGMILICVAIIVLVVSASRYLRKNRS